MTDRIITREVTRTRYITRVESPTRVITSNLGLPGDDGDPGDSAYAVAVANGFVGSEAAWLASLVGPAGAGSSDGLLVGDGPPDPSLGVVGNRYVDDLTGQLYQKSDTPTIWAWTAAGLAVAYQPIGAKFAAVYPFWENVGQPHEVIAPTTLLRSADVSWVIAGDRSGLRFADVDSAEVTGAVPVLGSYPALVTVAVRYRKTAAPADDESRLIYREGNLDSTTKSSFYFWGAGGGLTQLWCELRIDDPLDGGNSKYFALVGDLPPEAFDGNKHTIIVQRTGPATGKVLFDGADVTSSQSEDIQGVGFVADAPDFALIGNRLYADSGFEGDLFGLVLATDVLTGGEEVLLDADFDGVFRQDGDTGSWSPIADLITQEELDAAIAVVEPATILAARRDLPPLPATIYQFVREWATDFSSASRDALLFDLTNLSYTTDGGNAVVTPTDPDQVATVLTRVPTGDCDVLAKLRLAPGAGHAIDDLVIYLLGRFLDADNTWRGRPVLTIGNEIMQGSSVIAGGAEGTEGFSPIDATDATTYRWLRFQVTGDVCRMKMWFVGATEPVWQIIQRLRPPAGSPSLVSDTDNIDVGLMGISLLHGGKLQSLRVSELLKADVNMVWTPSPTEIGTGLDLHPVGWYPTEAPAGANTLGPNSLADRNGIIRPVFKFHKPDTGSRLSYTQTLWRGGTPNAFIARLAPHPRVLFTPHVAVSLWSKGTGILNVAGSIAASIVINYYDDAATLLNFGTLDYYVTLGPNGALGGANSHKGDGTWDWRKDQWILSLVNWERVTSMTVQIGFHDASATGDLWVADVSLTPAA